MVRDLTIRVLLNGQHPPWVGFTLAKHDELDPEPYECDFHILSVRVPAVPAVLEELAWLLLRHGGEVGEHFLTRLETGGSLPEPTLFSNP